MIISALLAGFVLLGGVFSFVHPISESQTGQRIGDPKWERSLYVALVDGTIGFKLGVPVQPPYQPFRIVNLAVIKYGIIDLPGSGSGYRLYTVSISLWFPLVLFSAWPLVSWWRGPVRRGRRKRRGNCESCGYDLRGNLLGTCSECGARVEGAFTPVCGTSGASDAHKNSQ